MSQPKPEILAKAQSWLTDVFDEETKKACDKLVPSGSVVANFHNTADWMKTAIHGVGPS